MYMYNNYISQDYLMHYGVKGMKWGVRHDPQPTGRMRRRAANQQYRQSVKAAGKRNVQAFRENYGSREARRSANQQFRNEVNAAKQKNKEAFALTDKQKKMAKRIAIGAAVVAGVGLATYGGVKLASIRSYNRASIAKFLDNNPEIANSVLQGGKPYKSHVERVINPFSNGTEIKGGSTVSVGKISKSIKGPTLKTSQSTVNAYRTNYYNRPGEKSRDAVSKFLEKDTVGANGRNFYFNKDQRKYYNKRYKDYVSKSLRQTWV